MIPSAHFGESCLNACLRFNQTRKLLQAPPELAGLSILWRRWRAREACNAGRGPWQVRGTILDRLDDLHRLECIFAGAAERSIRRGRIHGLEDTGSITIVTDPELVQIVDDNGFMFAAECT